MIQGKRLGLRPAAVVLALTLVATAAEPAGAWSWWGGSSTKHRAQATPLTTPVVDGDMSMTRVQTQPAIQQIGAPIAQAVATGVGVKVAILDGGFDLRHEALAGHLAPGWDCVGNDADPQDLGNGIDDDGDLVTDRIVGHGTFTASLVLATAPNARIVPIRVLDDEGFGTEDDIVEGVMVAMSRGVKVINMSLVVPNSSWALRYALLQASYAGITVVGSAGYGTEAWQNDIDLADRVFAVGAVDANDAMLEWSATGLTVDVYAPGENVIGALGGAIPNSYATWSGTSFATPFVSGTAALLLSAHPTWSTQTVISRVRATVAPATGVFPMWRGRIDAGAALTQ